MLYPMNMQELGPKTKKLLVSSGMDLEEFFGPGRRPRELSFYKIFEPKSPVRRRLVVTHTWLRFLPRMKRTACSMTRSATQDCKTGKEGWGVLLEVFEEVFFHFLRRRSRQ